MRFPIAILFLFFRGFYAQSHQFADKSEIHDQEHLKIHLENKIEIEKMTDEQQKFHYFSIHDLNKDNHIDGLEILKALMHDHEDQNSPGQPVIDESEMERLVDEVLADLDTNRDGRIDYAEYLKRQ